MKRKLLIFSMLLLTMSMQAQWGQMKEDLTNTARKFTIDLTDDGKAQMVCYLPKHPQAGPSWVYPAAAIRCCLTRTRVIWPLAG